ncbi:MAG: terminase, partial [Geminicoccaceae bacterium]
MSNALQDILAAFDKVPEEQREDLKRQVMTQTAGRKWFPNPGPQTDAYFCKADELFYGGQAGGGKSALVCGLSVEEHERSLILRRINKDAKKLAEAELLGNINGGDRDGWNGSDLIYRNGKQVIEFSGCENEQDKQRFKGDPHDLIAFDEATDFLESQYEFICTWNRSTNPEQRCRIVATGNPPTTAEGLWVIRRWAAWLDPRHSNPAQPGELRYYISDEDGKDKEVEGPGEYPAGDRMVRARSRTFIPAELSDNPDLSADGRYEALLDSLPKELRDAYRDGRFDLGLKDNPWQVIPTEWVQAAQERWRQYPPEGVPMCAMGLD